MRDDERRALAQVHDEYRYLFELLRREAAGDDGELVLQNLEATYVIRLYARFEGLLRQRLPPSTADFTLVNCIQALTGEAVGYDPVSDGRAITWWRLFQRDRNLLAHGRSLIPAIGIERSRTLMEEYLSRLRD